MPLRYGGALRKPVCHYGCCQSERWIRLRTQPIASSPRLAFHWRTPRHGRCSTGKDLASSGPEPLADDMEQTLDEILTRARRELIGD
jgi:hypothetical protein